MWTNIVSEKWWQIFTCCQLTQFHFTVRCRSMLTKSKSGDTYHISNPYRSTFLKHLLEGWWHLAQETFSPQLIREERRTWIKGVALQQGCLHSASRTSVSKIRKKWKQQQNLGELIQEMFCWIRKLLPRVYLILTEHRWRKGRERRLLVCNFIQVVAYNLDFLGPVWTIPVLSTSNFHL